MDVSDREVKSKSAEEENVSALWTNFTQNTGFHGVNKLTLGGGFKLRCFWWTLAIMCMTGYMIYNITKELINYYNYPTATSVTVQQSVELDFPAVTLCNLSPFSFSKVRAVDPELARYFVRNSFYGEQVWSIDWESEFLGPTFRESQSQEWWRNMSIDPSLIYWMCFMQSELLLPRCSEQMKPVVTKYGLCHTFNFNASAIRKVRLVGDENNLIIYAFLNQRDYVHSRQTTAGLRVILHEPDIHPDSVVSTCMTSPGTSTFVAIKKSTLKYLPAPYKAVDKGFCVETKADDFKNPLEYFETYTYDHCILECEIRSVYLKCNCTKAQDVGPVGPVCSIYHLETCYKPFMASRRQDPEFHDSCGCEIECSFSSFDAKLSSSKYPSNLVANAFAEAFSLPEYLLTESVLEIRIYYDSLIVHSTEQIAKYSLESLIGNIGGHIGICLGASILTFTELGEFLITVFVCILRKIKTGCKVKSK